MANRKWYLVGCMLTSAALLFQAGCGDSDEAKRSKEESRKRATQIVEARELARELKDNPPQKPADAIRAALKDASQTAQLRADFRFMYMGEDPDFWFKGISAAWHDKWSNLYYRDFAGDWAKHRVASGGRRPRWNKDLEEYRLVFEVFELQPGEWSGENKGIGVVDVMRAEDGYQTITDTPGFNVYYVNDGAGIAFQLDEKFYMIDQDMQETEITEEDFLQLVLERYTVDCPWNITDSYRGVPGLWLHSPDDVYHNQVWVLKELKTYKVAPETCYVYFISEETSGLLQLKPIPIQTYTLNKGSSEGVTPGDQYDVYERKLSPISGEAIGINPVRWRGSLRVTSVEEDSCKCELLTRAFRETITPGDLATPYDQQDIFAKVTTVE